LDDPRVYRARRAENVVLLVEKRCTRGRSMQRMTGEAKEVETETVLTCFYENQRWLPFTGWGNRLLPTDRPHYSDKKGKLVVHPSSLEPDEWPARWELHVDPEKTDFEGWRYAVDFPANYRKSPSPVTMVRRRRWQRKLDPTEGRAPLTGLPVAPPLVSAPPTPIDFDAPIVVNAVELQELRPQDRHFEDLLLRYVQTEC
jgi:hypothetical protein